MKKLFYLFTAVIVFSAMCFVSCSPKSYENEEKSEALASLKGTTWSGTLYNDAVNVTFTDSTISFELFGDNYSGTYAYDSPNISFVANAGLRTISAQGIVKKNTIELSVKYKNQYGDVKTSNDILVKN